MKVSHILCHPSPPPPNSWDKRKEIWCCYISSTCIYMLGTLRHNNYFFFFVCQILAWKSSPLPLLFMLCFFYFFLSQYSYLWLKSWIQLFPINIWTKHFLNFFLYIKWKVFWFLYIAWPDSPTLNNYCLLPLVVHVNWRVMCS